MSQDERRAQPTLPRRKDGPFWRGRGREPLPIGLNQGRTREEFPGPPAARRLVFVRLDRGALLLDGAETGPHWDRRSSN